MYSDPPRPPANWRDIAGWDRYWARVVAERRPGYDTRLTPVDAVHALEQSVELHRRGARRILFAGNGISLHPRAFAHAGFDVVALDVSRVATEYAFKNVPTAAEFVLFFQMDEGGNVGNFVDRFHRPGGKVEYVCGDLFDVNLEIGCFDAIWSSLALQGFTGADLDLAIRALDRRLAADGECRVLIHNNKAALARITASFAGLGYAVNAELDESTVGRKRVAILFGTG